MTIEEMNSVLEVKAKIESERVKLETLKLCSESITNEISDLPRSKALTSKPERFSVEIVATERRIIELQNQLVEVAAALATRITSELKNQNSFWTSILIRRYCACMTFKEIGESLGYTTDYIHLLHRQAMTFLFPGQWRPTRARRRQIA